MCLLPIGIPEFREGRTDTIVKLRFRPFDAIRRASLRDAGQPVAHGKVQQEREIGNEIASREAVGLPDDGFRQASSATLIGIRGQEEAIGNDDLTALESRYNLLGHDLGARRHEQERLGTFRHRCSEFEQEPADLIAKGRPSGLPDHEMPVVPRDKCITEKPNLSRFPDSFDPLEDDQRAAGGHQPSVMIELVAPFEIPCSIHSFTRVMIFSKLVCAETMR